MNDLVAVAVIGVAGAVVGSVAKIVASSASQWWQDRAAATQEEPRKKLLRALIVKPELQWRNLDTLMHVIGADEAKTKQLLLEVGARASEDGKPVWGLTSRNPIP